MDWILRHSALSLSFPKVMGILNITPDSFSDGGKFFDPSRAIERALQIEAEGADLLDLGAESTRPGSSPIEAEEEWTRVNPVLSKLRDKIRIPISVDTRNCLVASRALDAGADIINDVSCASDPALLRAVGMAKAGYILMHSRGRPRDMMEQAVYEDLLPEVKAELSSGLQRALQAGIAANSVVIDPGFGFAKTPEQNWILLGRLKELQDFQRPVLVGVSRKRFLREITSGQEHEVLAAGIGAALAACQAGARLLRVHDVAATRTALQAFQMTTNRIQD